MTLGSWVAIIPAIAVLCFVFQDAFEVMLLRMEAILVKTGLNWKGGSESEETLAALRATYEPLLDGLASALLLSLPT
jgi:hypothetical protein